MSQQDHVYTFKRAIQELSSSCQKPCTGTRRGKTTFTSFNHANPWALAKALLKERMSQQDRVYIVPLQRERRVNNHWSEQLLKCHQPTLTTPSGLYLGRQLT